MSGLKHLPDSATPIRLAQINHHCFQTFMSNPFLNRADRNSGGESGCAAIVHYPEHLNRPDEQILDFGSDESSINRMGLMAGPNG